MSAKSIAARFRIEPGKRAQLDRRDPGDLKTFPNRKAAEKQSQKDSEAIDKLQDRLYAEGKRALLVVLQGTDTGGKDGTIRHVFNSVDPLGVRVASFKTPTEEEKAHDFLWRVHRQAPGNGEIVIFNRSHYEDVLITRVHGWIDGKECARRYKHINAFEKLLAQSGTTILKFYLHISRDEQKRRLQARLDDPDKQWKFRLADLDERKRWDDYTAAYEDALAATSTDCAPWFVVPADSKTSRNVFISKVLVKTLEDLKLRYPQSQENLQGVVVE